MQREAAAVEIEFEGAGLHRRAGDRILRGEGFEFPVLRFPPEEEGAVSVQPEGEGFIFKREHTIWFSLQGVDFRFR